MADGKQENLSDLEITKLAEGILESLAAQFPVCMASDEFHYFPQARARSVDWSRWDNFSPDAMADIIACLKRWALTIDHHLSRPVSFTQTIELSMLRRVLTTLGEQFGSVRIQETQPTFYLTIVGIGLAEAFESGDHALTARLENLPAFLDQARTNLSRMPRLFRDLGLEMLVKQQSWVNSLTLPDTFRVPIHTAFHQLHAHLERANVHEDFLPPVDLYARIASYHMGCFLPPDDIAAELELEIAETRSILEQFASANAPGKPWKSVIETYSRPPMLEGGIAEVYQDTILNLAGHCTEQGLVSTELVQQCPVKVESIPDYMRPVRSNAAYSMPPGHPPRGGTFFIRETGKKAATPADYRLLTAHETYPGHHLLDTCRWNQTQPIRRHIEFPVFYEGWASFAEELLFETGFFSGPTDRMLLAKRRFWRAIRGQVDFDIHMRRRTLDEAAVWLTSTGMPPDLAAAMVRRYSLKPGYQLAYTIGRRHFRRLYKSRRQQKPDPTAFARRILEQGEIGFNHLEQVIIQGG